MQQLAWRTFLTATLIVWAGGLAGATSLGAAHATSPQSEASASVQSVEQEYRLHPSTRNLLILAGAYERAQMSRHALAAYLRFLRQTPQSPLRPVAQARVEYLQRQPSLIPRPFLDVSIGLTVSGRRLTFAEDARKELACFSLRSGSYQLTPCPRFVSGAVSGLRLDATAFPFARFDRAVVHGLGLGLTAEFSFWPATRIGEQGALDTREIRFDTGLRYVLRPALERPGIVFSIQYHLHLFSLSQVIQARAASIWTGDTGLPSMRYQGVEIGLGGTIPYHVGHRLRAGLGATLHYRALFAYGEVSDRCQDTDCAHGGYGPVQTGHGLRALLTALELHPYRGMTIRLQGSYELYALVFQLAQSGLAPPVQRAVGERSRYLAESAIDQYFGGAIQLGYLF